MNGTAFSNVLVGTCGYSYDDWKDSFYPSELSRREYLRYYSLFFPFVEIDSTWYSMPSRASMRSLSERTGSAFRFAVKLHRSLTHDVAPDWSDRALEFCRAAGCLAERDKLSAVLVQFPYRFAYTRDNRIYLASLLRALSEFPVVVEFRRADWFSRRVYEGLEGFGVGLVLVDRPDLPGLPPEIGEVTSPLAYLRFHGRNADAWWNGGVVGRYDYLYSEQEMQAAVPRVAELSRKAATVLVAFNNHAAGKAVTNARMLTARIREHASIPQDRRPAGGSG